MFKILCVTNRSLCKEDFLVRIDKIASAKPAAIILREKDLSPEKYKELAKKVMSICKAHGVLCILHNFVDEAISLKCDAIHLPLPVLKSLPKEKLSHFSIIGASCHSLEDALLCEKLGCSYITYGHIFETDCKMGLPGRGVESLKELCSKVSLLVFALGGIHPSNIQSIMDAGADGACMMSEFMTIPNPENLMVNKIEE